MIYVVNDVKLARVITLSGLLMLADLIANDDRHRPKAAGSWQGGRRHDLLDHPVDHWLHFCDLPIHEPPHAHGKGARNRQRPQR
jgi:hypothetical protein